MSWIFSGGSFRELKEIEGMWEDSIYLLRRWHICLTTIKTPKMTKNQDLLDSRGEEELVAVTTGEDDLSALPLQKAEQGADLQHGHQHKHQRLPRLPPPEKQVGALQDAGLCLQTPPEAHPVPLLLIQTFLFQGLKEERVRIGDHGREMKKEDLRKRRKKILIIMTEKKIANRETSH